MRWMAGANYDMCIDFERKVRPRQIEGEKVKRKVRVRVNKLWYEIRIGRLVTNKAPRRSWIEAKEKAGAVGRMARQMI